MVRRRMIARWMMGSAIGALLAAGAGQAMAEGAQAENAADAPAAKNAEPAGGRAQAVSEIVVTGSRIQSGFQRQTPVAVVSVEQLQRSQPAGIAAALNQMPQFLGSASPSQAATVTIGQSRGNYLNLRNVGITRTLILLDGVRVPPTTAAGEVNVDVIPELLVSRVDVVTAGVSAVYGSDAVTGVVNYILDSDFTGVKGVLQKGVSTHGDGDSYRLGAAAGFSGMDGRAHLLVSVERNDTGEVRKTDRPFTTPVWTTAPRLRPGTALPGGGVAGAPGSASNPLAFISGVYSTNGSRFGPRFINGPPGVIRTVSTATGQIVPYEVGGYAGASAEIGGSGGNFPPRTLIPGVTSDRVFARASYEIAPDWNAYAQVTGAKSRTAYEAVYTNVVAPVFIGNPFLPASVASALAATGSNTAATTACGGGTPVQACIYWRPDEAPFQNPRQLETNKGYTVRAGIQGKVFGDWNVDATYVHGYVHQSYSETGVVERTHAAAALDAVVNPATGTVVCRVTLLNPTGPYGNCLPVNPFVPGSNSQQAIDYLYGTPESDLYNKTDDFIINLSGDIFSTWAGPVGIALGAEYRTGSLRRTSNSDPTALLNVTGLRGIAAASGRYSLSGTGLASGSNEVKEVNGEIMIPLARDLAWARELSVNGAIRYTDYSTSGSVVTWKLGGSYEPVEGLRVRATRSRDIRAPSLFDLYAGGTSTFANVNDAHCNCSPRAEVIGGGNPDLTPEQADTWAAGVVVQPGFLRGLSASLDYYNIDITDAITQLSVVQIIQRCEDSAGASPICASITRPLPFSDRTAANGATKIFQGVVNSAFLKTSGIDLEMIYKFPVTGIGGRDGQMTLRGYANHAITFTTQGSESEPVRRLAGYTDGPVPKWRGSISATYDIGRLGVFVQGRYIGGLKTGPANIYEVKTLPSVWYADLTVNYRLPVEGRDVGLFMTVNNVFNKKPILFPAVSQQPNLIYPTIQSLYDVMGRYFTAGARFQF